jgi:5-methylcytosine-specific restriction protein A
VNDLRPAQLLREPFCRECARRGIRTVATDVDHIRDHKGDWALFIDRENLESLCHGCHSRKTVRENRR